MKSVMRKFLEINFKLSRNFDLLLSEKYRTDGNLFFIEKFAPAFLHSDLIVYDIGGGKNPYISQEVKSRLHLRVTGLDVDQEELARAPVGAYDSVVCADITTYKGEGEADLVICQALLEHVRSVDKAIASIASILKPGGIALIFVPSRNALFARLNILLPEKVKKILLYSIYPKARASQGFPSYYDQCTPRDFRRIATRHNLSVERESFHYISSYFSFCFPLYLVWRVWILTFHALAGSQAAETFCMALRKQQ